MKANLKYEDIAEIWQVDDEDFVNMLLKLGWKLLETTHEDKEIKQETFWSYKIIGAKSEVVYIMGRDCDVPARKDEVESVYSYRDRVKNSIGEPEKT